MSHRALSGLVGLWFALAGCNPSPTASPAGESGDVGTAAADDWEAWTAAGNEPGWRLGLEAERLKLQWNYGSDEAVFPRPMPSLFETGRRYVSQTEAHDLRIDVTYEICRDTMTGMPYPHQVTVVIDDSTLSGCGGSPDSLLLGGEWLVEDLAGDGLVADSRATLLFGRDGQLTGGASCNRYGAAWRLTGEGLTVANARATRMACTPALDRQETAFLRLLEAVHHFDITDDGALVLHTADGATITARRQ